MANPKTFDQETSVNRSESALNLEKLVLICSKKNDGDNLRCALERYGFSVQNIDNIYSVEDVVSLSIVNVVIIDSSFLYADASAIFRRLLSTRYRPGILVRSTSNDEIDRIVALDMGTDDCVDESCSVREIGARTAAISRRASVRSEIKRTSSKSEFSGWELQSDTRQLITPLKNIISLTGAEYLIIGCLLSNPGSVKSRSDLRCYPDTDDNEDSDPRTMDVIVSRLRKKMMYYGDENIIETVRGFGYRLITR